MKISKEKVRERKGERERINKWLMRDGLFTKKFYSRFQLSPILNPLPTNCPSFLSLSLSLAVFLSLVISFFFERISFSSLSDRITDSLTHRQES